MTVFTELSHQKIDVDGTNIIVSSKIPVFLEKDITSVDWNKLECDILVESSWYN